LAARKTAVCRREAAEALELISKAVELDPENGAYLDSLGWALFRLDRFEEAERRIRESLEREGANAVILDHLGDILSRSGRAEAAIEQWRKALEGEDEDGELDRANVERMAVATMTYTCASLDELLRAAAPAFEIVEHDTPRYPWGEMFPRIVLRTR